MKLVLALLLSTILIEPASAETKTLLAEKLLVQWGGPETRVRCSKWASTTGVKCSGLKCGRTTWKTCIGHATDLLQHKRVAQVFAHDYPGDLDQLRTDVVTCLERTWKKGISATQVSNFLRTCLTKKKAWGLTFSVSVKSETHW